MTPPKKILIIYEFFYPAYKAGGVVQSLKNMVSLMHQEYEFYCITGGYDLNEELPLKGIQLNSWNSVSISEEATIQVWYDDKRSLSPFKLHKLMAYVHPDIVYINGFMSIPFLMNPLWVIQYAPFKTGKIIIAPRGMLQEGALAEKSFKKKVYLKLLQFWNLTKGVEWHVTSDSEVPGIQQYFTIHDHAIHCVGNIPTNPVVHIVPSGKTEGTLNLVYASIITGKKNLLLVLQALKYCTAPIKLDIYGTIKEPAYWSECETAIQVLPQHIAVKYLGGFKPAEMQEIVSKYDAMILLSKGENFSHAIFECLGAGRPIISSFFTSWNELNQKKAGWNLPINQPELIASHLNELALLNQTNWQAYCNGAHRLANDYLNNQSFVSDYTTLFG